MRSVNRIIGPAIAAALLLATAAPLFAQTAVDSGTPEPAPRATPHLEQPDDEPAGPTARVPSAPAATSGPWIRGSFVSVQVNTDAFGDNIPGDAANEPSLAIDPTDPSAIVVGWRQFDNVASNFRQAGRATSTDGGQTWINLNVFTPGQFRSDPVLAAGPDGMIYYNSLKQDFTCDMFLTNDGGQTWSGAIPALGGDKAWMAVDNTDSIGRGHIYIAWSTAAGCCGDRTFIRSTNNGVSYSQALNIPSTPVFGTLAVGPDGELYVVGVNQPSFFSANFVLAKSTNARDANTTPTFDFVTSLNMGGAIRGGGGVNPDGLLGQAWVACDHTRSPNRGNVYVLCSVDRPGGDPLDVMFIRSEDGGQTWTSPIRVNDDPTGNGAYQWFGTMSVAPNGRIDAAWADTRNDPGDNFSEIYYSNSTDAGQTWADNVVITPPYNHSLGYPNQNKLGDYYDMISDNTGANLIYAATFNDEQDVYFVRIEHVDCNDNGVNDVDDIANQTSNDCNNNSMPDECEPDCNNNNSPDECDIDDETSLDCNANFTPDECEPDCNGNGVPDDCDVASSTSPDCNDNNTPDECDVDNGDSEDCNGNGVPDECDSADLITLQPSDAQRCPGTDAVFQVVAAGSPTYRWYKDDVPLIDGGGISGAFTDTLTVADVDDGDTGAYSCDVVDGCIGATSVAALLSLADPPTVVRSPNDLDACEDQPAALVAEFGGTPPFNYQWEKFDGISGQWEPVGRTETATLTFPAITSDDAGAYRCQASNACDDAVTAAATITVHPLPQILRQPEDVCAEIGETAVLLFEASGEEPLTYVWLKDSVVFSGPSNEPTLVLEDIQPEDAGVYSAAAYMITSCTVLSETAALQVGGCAACPSPGDLDGDGDVDVADFAAFQACFGPGQGVFTDCRCANLDATDDDIDTADWSLFEAAFTGPLPG
jgi:hypothetical protein